MGSLFINYGVKAGGGPPFLKRTRSAYAQIQTRTRSGSSFSQRQRQDGTCSCVASGPWRYYYYYTVSCCDFNYGGYPQCRELGVPDTYRESQCWINSIWEPSNFPAHIPYLNHYNTSCGSSYCSWPISVVLYSDQPQSCSSSYGGWYNVSSCSSDTQCAWTRSGLRNCRTVTGCNWGGWSGWSNVSSCSPSSSCSSNGGRECQTIYLWNAWSEWEEAETCTPQTPNASNGAIQIECQAV